MQIETLAIAYKAESFHSNAKNVDYHTLGLIVEGVATSFFVSDDIWDDVVKQPWFNGVCVNHEPTKVLALLEVKFTEKGSRVYLNGVKTPKEK